MTLTKSTIAPFALRCLGIAAIGGVINCNSVVPIATATPANADMARSALDLSSPEPGSPDLATTDLTRRLFVSSQSFTMTDITTKANMMNALTVLDDECRTLADNGLIQGTRKFRAWFSTNGGNDPASRFAAARMHPKVAYVLPNGRQVADSWDMLTSLGGAINYQLTHAINVTETGAVLPCPDEATESDAAAPASTSVWTNVQPNGLSALQDTCIGEQLKSVITIAAGNYCARDANWTQQVDAQNDALSQSVSCGPTSLPIYCVEDEDSADDAQ
jgi:hypothetical protein